MKILLVTSHFPPDIGGIEYHVFNLARGLSKRHEVTVVTCGLNNGMEAHSDFKVIRLPFVAPPPYPYQTLSNWKIPYPLNWFSKVSGSDEFDIVHIHGHHYPMSWVAVRGCGDTPCVLTLHGMYALNSHRPGGRTIFEEIFNKTLFRLMLQRIDAVIGLTSTILDYARKYSSSSVRFHTIPNGVDLELYSKNLERKSEYRQKYGIPNDNVVVIFSGRLCRAKGVLELALAIREIVKRRRDVFFLLIGDGPLGGSLRSMLDGLENVKLMGWVPNQDIHELEIAADILVIPSKWEALPITLIEGIAAQMHIVATPVGGVVDVLEDYVCKTYIKGFTAKHIAEGLDDALCARARDALDSLKEKKTQRINTEYVKQFDWNNILEKVEVVYDEVVQN